MYGCSSFFFSKGKRGGAWLVRLGRLLQAEKGLRPGGGRSPFSAFLFLAAPERAALFPRGRAPESLGWIGKLFR